MQNFIFTIEDVKNEFEDGQIFLDERDLNKLEVTKIKGGFASILFAEYAGKTVVIKRIKLAKKFGRDKYKSIVNEIRVHLLRSEYIVDFFGIYFGERKLHIVIEYIHGQDLTSIIENSDEDSFPLNLRMKIALDAVKGIKFLHENGVIHGDIKPPNIIVNIDSKNAKLIDFGFSQFIDDGLEKAFGFTITYSAPELILEGEITKSADIYSFGATLFTILTFLIPHDGYKWEDVKAEEEISLPENIEDIALRELFSLTVDLNIENRIDIHQVETMMESICSRISYTFNENDLSHIIPLVHEK